EGDEAQTGPDSQAFIQLFDGSTVHTYFDTSLRIERLRTSQFFSSLKEANLFLSTGTLVLATAKLSGFSDATYTVATDDAVVNVKPDSTVRVEVDGAGDQQNVQVVVDIGSAIVQSHGRQVEVLPAGMALVKGNNPPEGPLPASQELVRNGNFTEPWTSGKEQTENGGLGVGAWLPINAQGADV